MARVIDPVDLTARLVAAKSPSGEEDAAADVVAEALRAAGLEPRRVERNVWAERGSGARALLFNSHIDTVPAGPGWTRDPWRPAVEDGKLYGLGANDAKSCVAAMLAAFVAAPDPGPRGRLIFAATAEEEGPAPCVGSRSERGFSESATPPARWDSDARGTPTRPAPGAAPGTGCRGLEVVLPHLGPLAGGVIGEPTALQICAGQRGRAVLRLVCEGKAGHASRPHEGVNAIHLAATVLLALAVAGDLEEARDPLLGLPTIAPTLIEGGTKSNVIPARCAVTLDVRTTPLFDNETAARTIAEIAAPAALRFEVGSAPSPRGAVRLEVVNARFRPFATPPDAAILRAARAALPDARVRAFGGVSDLFHLANAPGGPIPGVIVGPGESAQSHQADEFVRVDAVRAAAAAYVRIAKEFLA